MPETNGSGSDSDLPAAISSLVPAASTSSRREKAPASSAASQRASQAGRARYTTRADELIVQGYAKERPKGQDGYKRAAVLINKLFKKERLPERDWKNLKKRFQKVCRTFPY